MILRKLKPEEHIFTRTLWEEIFKEDSEKFLNYYYNDITSNNEIYVIEMDGAIRAMLHLNPYRFQLGTKEVESRYIVAVATEAAYRGQGYMSELLKKSVRDMYGKRIPFAYLMPAAESIYYPHHFRYIYRAPKWQLEKGEIRNKSNWKLRMATASDCKKVAAFVQPILSNRYNVYTQRDGQYYEVKLREQQSMDGNILLLERDDEIKGTVFMEEEDGVLTIREPLFQEEGEQGFQDLGLRFVEKEKRPLIMARVICVEEMLSCVRCKEEVSFSFALVDPVIQENNKIYIIKGNPERMVIRTKPWIRGREQGIQLLSIDALTSIIFGYRSLEEIEEEEQESFSDSFKEELIKLEPLNSIYINEIV